MVAGRGRVWRSPGLATCRPATTRMALGANRNDLPRARSRDRKATESGQQAIHADSSDPTISHKRSAVNRKMRPHATAKICQVTSLWFECVKQITPRSGLASVVKGKIIHENRRICWCRGCRVPARTVTNTVADAAGRRESGLYRPTGRDLIARRLCCSFLSFYPR